MLGSKCVYGREIQTSFDAAPKTCPPAGYGIMPEVGDCVCMGKHATGIDFVTLDFLYPKH